MGNVWRGLKKGKNKNSIKNFKKKQKNKNKINAVSLQNDLLDV